MKTTADLTKQYVRMFDLLKLPPILPHQIAMFIGVENATETMVYSMNVELMTAIQAVTDGYIEALNEAENRGGTVMKLNADLMVKTSDYETVKHAYVEMEKAWRTVGSELEESKKTNKALAEQQLNERLDLHSKIIKIKEQLDAMTVQHLYDESLIHEYSTEIKMKDAVIDNLRDESEQVTNELMLAHKRDMRQQRKRGRKVYHVDWDTMIWLSTEGMFVRFESFIDVNNIGIGEGSIIKNTLELGQTYIYNNGTAGDCSLSLKKPRQQRSERVAHVHLDKPVMWWEEKLMNLLSGKTSEVTFTVVDVLPRDVILTQDDTNGIKELECVYRAVSNWNSRHNRMVRNEKHITDKRTLHIHWVSPLSGPNHTQFVVYRLEELTDFDY